MSLERDRDRELRMRELMKPIDYQIMMCDNEKDLLELASIMMVSSKNIFVKLRSKDFAREVLEKLIKDL
jgi:hypothetical protein